MSETALIDRSGAVKRPSHQRAKITNRPRQMVVSGNTALGRRLRDLADDYAEQLGGWSKLNDMMAANVRRAAELVALSEQSRADALRNGCTDFVGLARLEGVADRARRALGLPTGKPEPAEPSLHDYLAAQAGERSV